MPDVNTNGCTYNSPAAAAANATALANCVSAGGSWTVSGLLYVGTCTLNGSGTLSGAGTLLLAGTLTLTSIGGMDGLTINGRVHLTSANLSNKELINLKVSGGPWLFPKGTNLEGLRFSAEVTSVDESLVGSFFEGEFVGIGYSDNNFTSNGGYFTVNSTADVYVTHEKFESIVHAATAIRCNFTLTGNCGLINQFKFAPISYNLSGTNNFPWRSSKYNRVKCTTTGYAWEERVVRDDFGGLNVAKTGYVTNVSGDTFQLQAGGYSSPGTLAFVGLDVCIIQTTDSDNAREGTIFEITGYNAGTFTASGSSGGLKNGDFVSVCQTVSYNIIEDCSLMGGHDRGAGILLIGGIYGNTIRRCETDIQDGFYAGLYVDPELIVLPNHGISIKAYLYAGNTFATSSIATGRYSGVADNTVEDCYVYRMKEGGYNFCSIVNQGVDADSYDYFAGDTPAGMPKVLCWRNKLINCAAEYTGADAGNHITDQRDFVYIGNTLPVNRDSWVDWPLYTNSTTAGENTFAVDGDASSASLVGDTIIITAWAESTIYADFDDATPTTPRTAGVPFPVAGNTLYYYATDEYYTEETKSLVVNKSRNLLVGGQSRQVRASGAARQVKTN